MADQLISLTDLIGLQAAGLPFRTEYQARWASRQSSETGMSGAFIRIGRRVFIDPQKFHELARSHSQQISQYGMRR